MDELQKEIKNATGVNVDTTKLGKETLLDFIESGNGTMSQEDIDAVIDNMVDAVIVPEEIEQKPQLDKELGLTTDDLKTLYRYLSGKSNVKPDFLDRYLAGSTTKLIDFQHVITLIRLAQIPQLAALNQSIQQRLYSPENLLSMDVKELTTASANISREISDTLNSANKSIELINTYGRVDNKYQQLIDKLLVVPDDVLTQIEHLLNNYQ